MGGGRGTGHGGSTAAGFGGATGDGDARSRLRETLVELCRIPSPTFSEAAVAAVVRRRLEECGMDVREDDAGKALGGDSGNLIGELPGGRPGRIALVAHMDTVPPVPGVPLEPIVDGDRVHTGGRQILGADDKAGVCVLLEVVRAVASAPFDERPTVLAVLTVAEERGLLGARELDVAALRADFAYVLDGEVPVGEVIAAAPYKEALDITVTGRRAHAALEPEHGVHAIAAAARFLNAFPLGRQGERSITNIGMIQGGTATNVVPDEVVLRGEMRGFGEEDLEGVAERIEEARVAVEQETSARIRVERRRLYDGYDLPSSAASLSRLEAAAQELGDQPCRRVSSIGGSDTNILVGKGLEAVNVGLGMHDIHGPSEWIRISDLERCAIWLRSAISAASRS